MALQHFYSRVPARMAMWTKCDSFDTFAKSGEITKEYIRANLAKICEFKPTDDELELIMADKLPPVFTSCFGKSDELIQSKFSFVSSDYTGERPGWMCHSLVLSKEESDSLFSTPDSVLLNKDAFGVTLADFNLSDKSVRANPDYPAAAYPAAEVKSLSEWAEGIDGAILKKVIFAIINAAASNQKNVYISLSKPYAELSENALEFINHLILIFPGTVKRKISFTTSYNDNIPTKLYKVRFIPGNLTDICSNRGYVVDTGRKISYGIYEDDLIEIKDELDFLYSLFFDRETRLAFLSFYDEAVSAKGDTNNFNLKVFLDLIYLFRHISGKFEEKEIVPDDNAVLKMITTYEKYRNQLKTPHRQTILSVLYRYSELRVAIPAGVFTRIGKIYPTEPSECKKTIMTVILDLLHTNIMREKLFAFISSTYESETAESRDIICEDLSRVFYGGFLQSDILDFYTKYFAGESEETKEIILEKLLMTIRTPAVQKKILNFIEKHQSGMSPKLKQMVYHTFYEMLPENDMLSKRIVPVMAKCMTADDFPTRQKVFETVLNLINTDREKGTGELLSICLIGVRNNLPLGNMIVKTAFEEWIDTDRFDIVLTNLLGNTLVSVGNGFKVIFGVLENIPEKAYTLLFERAKSVIDSVSPKNDLFDFMDFDKKSREALNDCITLNGRDFYDEFYNSVIIPVMGAKLTDAFNTNRNKIGLAGVLEFAERSEKLKNHAGTTTIKAVVRVIELVKAGNAEEALGVLTGIPLYMESGKLVMETLKTEFASIEDTSVRTGDVYNEAVIGAMYSYLENGKIILSPIFGKCLEKRRAYSLYNRCVKAKSSVKDIQDEDSQNAMTVLAVIVRLCVAVSVMNCSAEVKESLYINPDSELDRLAKKVLSTATKKSKDLFYEIYSYALHGCLRIARKLENAVIETNDCPRAFKKLF